MAEYIRFVDAVNGEPEYDSQAYAQAEEVKAEGVAYGYLNQLEVIEDTALQVIVKDGGMVSRGRIYIQDESSDGTDPKTLAIEAATSGYLRKDIVAVEFDIDNKVASAKIVKGTELTDDPNLPTLIDADNKWQVSIAVVNVSGSAITSIEDQRVIGNGRTNPAFLEDLSAPNIKINDGGKIYLNDAETAYLSYESNALNFKTPDRSEVNISGGLVAEVVLDADATSVTINNLDMAADGDIYEIYIKALNSMTAALDIISMYANSVPTLPSSDIFSMRHGAAGLLTSDGDITNYASLQEGYFYLGWTYPGVVVPVRGVITRADNQLTGVFQAGFAISGKQRFYSYTSSDLRTQTNVTSLIFTGNFAAGTTIVIRKIR